MNNHQNLYFSYYLSGELLEGVESVGFPYQKVSFSVLIVQIKLHLVGILDYSRKNYTGLFDISVSLVY